MRKTQHPSNNGVLGAPAGWDQKSMPCDALAITRMEWGGGPAILSFWEPTAEEIEQLLAGGKVALWVVGTTMPPVALTVEPK